MTNRQMRWLALSLFGASMTMGCSSSAINPGDAGTSLAQLATYAGTWDGHAEAWSFGADGSDRVRLTLDATGNGTLQVGEGTLPPPTDPDVGYPAGGDPSSSINALTEGYAYPTHSTRIEAGRVQFGVNLYDLFSGWCALQVPVFVANSTGPDDAGRPIYGCLPDLPLGASFGPGPGNPPDGSAQCVFAGLDGSVLAWIDCGKAALCGQMRVCTCTESACTSLPTPPGLVPAQYLISFDGALENPPTTLTATLAMNTTRVIVHLTRK